MLQQNSVEVIEISEEIAKTVAVFHDTVYKPVFVDDRKLRCHHEAGGIFRMQANIKRVLRQFEQIFWLARKLPEYPVYVLTAARVQGV